MEGSQTFKYKGPRNLENLEQFAYGGYLNSTQDEDRQPVPRRLKGMEKLQKNAKDTLDELARGVDMMFVKFNLSFIPSIVRYLLVLSLVLSPLIGLVVMLFVSDEEEVIKPRPNPTKVKPMVKSPTKREKIE